MFPELEQEEESSLPPFIIEEEKVDTLINPMFEDLKLEEVEFS